MSSVELRCPVGPQRLFGKAVLTGDRPAVVDGNLLEFACADCRRTRRARGEEVALVLHRYNILGEHIEDEIVRKAFIV